MLRLLESKLTLSPTPFRKAYLYNVGDNLKMIVNLLAARIIYFHSMTEVLGIVILLASFFVPFWAPFALLLYLDCIAIVFYPFIIVCDSFDGEHVTFDIELTPTAEGLRGSCLYTYQGVKIYRARNMIRVDPNLLNYVLDDYVRRTHPDPLQTWYVNRYLEPIGKHNAYQLYA